jgi:23S rRNA (cytosine1962-C5)-methyltransferase
MNNLIIENWKSYELIDSGNREKLERFGSVILNRPEPQAIWNKNLDEAEWKDLENARFERSKATGSGQHSDTTGIWTFRKKIREEWKIDIEIEHHIITLLLKFTKSGHIGVFPEQLPNWNYIYRETLKLQTPGTVPKILNLFAYTGAATLAALAAGADVFHVDSVRQMINWTENNRELSRLPKLLHLVVEDAMTYLKREVKRGKVYQGILLDPPSYGRGPEGEKWIFEDQINELLKLCSLLLDKNKGFLVLNWYSMGLSAYVMLNLINNYFEPIKPEFGEMVIKSKSLQYLPLGTFLRFNR